MVGTIHQESTITEAGKTFKLTQDIKLEEQGVDHTCPKGEHWDDAQGKCVPDSQNGDPGLPPKNGWFEQPEKGANQDPYTWVVSKMSSSKPSGWRKVVDNKKINVAVEFRSATDADQYIKHFRWIKDHPPQAETKAIISKPNQTVAAGATVALDGSKSTNATPQTRLTYLWQQAGGPSVVIANADTAIGTFKATEDNSQSFTYKFSLTVTDSKGNSDSAIASVITSTNPQPGGDKDIEGIQKIYEDDPSKSEQQFFLHKDGNSSSRLGGKGDRKVLSDGSIQISPTSTTSPPTARIYIRTTEGSFNYEDQLAAGGNDWNLMFNRADSDGVKRGGWMMTEQDYREVENTHYYRIPKIQKHDQMTNYVGGGHPSGDDFPLQCISSCYKLQLETEDCSSRAAIEVDHAFSPEDYCWRDDLEEKFNLKDALGGTMENKIIGQKYVRYNEVVEGKGVVAVHQELWLDLESKDLDKPDLSRQKWQFYVEAIHTKDPDNWPTQPQHDDYIKGCNASGLGKFVCWGAPVYGMRFDESDWIMYYLSIRPIIVKKNQ